MDEEQLREIIHLARHETAAAAYDILGSIAAEHFKPLDDRSDRINGVFDQVQRICVDKFEELPATDSERAEIVTAIVEELEIARHAVLQNFDLKKPGSSGE